MVIAGPMIQICCLAHSDPSVRTSPRPSRVPLAPWTCQPEPTWLPSSTPVMHSLELPQSGTRISFLCWRWCHNNMTINNFKLSEKTAGIFLTYRIVVSTYDRGEKLWARCRERWHPSQSPLPWSGKLVISSRHPDLNLHSGPITPLAPWTSKYGIHFSILCLLHRAKVLDSWSQSSQDQTKIAYFSSRACICKIVQVWGWTTQKWLKYHTPHDLPV